MKILFLSPLPPPIGGVSTWTKILVEEGLPEGFDFRVVNTKILGSRIIFDGKINFFWEACRAVRIFLALLRALFFYRPHIVHVNVSPSFFGLYQKLACSKVVKFFSPKLVMHYHGDLPKRCASQKSQAVLKKLLKITDLSLVLNDASLVFLKSLGDKNQVKAIRIRKICNFFDQKIIPEMAKKEGDRAGSLKAIFVGGLALQKGVKEIVELARRLPTIEFLLIGHAVPDTQELLRKLPKNINAMGSLPREAVLAELSQADVFIFPSHTEGFPNAMLEAMACGLPVVSTRVGAIPEMIDENLGGFLLDVDDVNGMAESLRKLEVDQDLCLKMGEHNFTKAHAEYAYSGVIKKLTGFYKQLANGEIESVI